MEKVDKIEREWNKKIGEVRSNQNCCRKETYDLVVSASICVLCGEEDLIVKGVHPRYMERDKLVGGASGCRGKKRKATYYMARSEIKRCAPSKVST